MNVSHVARLHGIQPSLLFKWKKQYREGSLTDMDGIFFVLRTGCQWNNLNANGICSSSFTHRRFQDLRDAGVFERFWQKGLLTSERLEDIDWSWLYDKIAAVRNKKTGRNPTEIKCNLLTDAIGLPLSLVVAAANTHDIKLAAATLYALQACRPG